MINLPGVLLLEPPITIWQISVNFKNQKALVPFLMAGMSKDVRQLFGLFRTDTLTSSNILVTKLGNVVGWPSRYSTRVGKNPWYIAIGIMNVTQPDSIDGIYLYNFKNEKLEKYSKVGALPSLSGSGSLMAYCIHNKLVIDDYESKNTLFSYLLNFEPVFVTWKSDNEIYIFFSNPFRVKVLNIKTGLTSDSRLKYIKNFDQEVGIERISKIFKGSPKGLKEILDKSN